jgi:hypothetical protein
VVAGQFTSGLEREEVKGENWGGRREGWERKEKDGRVRRIFYWDVIGWMT